MNSIILSWVATAALLVSVIAAMPAEATVDHTYVSGKGTDTGGCINATNACRTFAYAVSQTTAGGEIIVLDPADYSPVTITGPISIVADGGGPAGIILASGNAITINAGSTGVVNLRGLTLDGEGTAASGIVLNSAGSLTVENCFIRNFQNSGILLTTTGLPIFSNLNVSVLNSVLNNSGAGLTVTGTGGLDAGTYLTVRNSVANYNVIGFSVTGAVVTFANSMATGNTEYAIFVGPINGDRSHSTLLSYGDNEFSGNGTEISGGTLVAVEKQ
jgi:hypothetical protein